MKTKDEAGRKGPSRVSWAGLGWTALASMLMSMSRFMQHEYEF